MNQSMRLYMREQPFGAAAKNGAYFLPSRLPLTQGNGQPRHNLTSPTNSSSNDHLPGVIFLTMRPFIRTIFDRLNLEQARGLPLPVQKKDGPPGEATALLLVILLINNSFIHKKTIFKRL